MGVRSITLFAASLAAAVVFTNVAHAAPDGGCAEDAGVDEECLSGMSARALLEHARREAEQRKLVQALRHSQDALVTAIRERDATTATEARELVKTLIDAMPHVTFVPPSDTKDLKVTFDDRTVPFESLTKKFSVDPGRHVVRAEGTSSGIPSSFEETIEIRAHDFVTVRIVMQRLDSCMTCASPAQMACLHKAKNQGDVDACLAQLAPSERSGGCRACIVAPARDGYGALSGVIVLLPLLAFYTRRRRVIRRGPSGPSDGRAG